MSNKFTQSFTANINQTNQISQQANQDAALDNGSNAAQFAPENARTVPGTGVDPNLPQAKPVMQEGGGLVFVAAEETNPKKLHRIRAANAHIAGAQFLRNYPEDDEIFGIVRYMVRDPRTKKTYRYEGKWEPISKNNAILMGGGLIDKNGKMKKLPADNGKMIRPTRFFTQDFLGNSGCGCS